MSIMMFLSLWWSHTKLLRRHQFVFAEHLIKTYNSPQNPHCLAFFSIIRVLWDAICRVFVSFNLKNVTALFLSTVHCSFLCRFVLICLLLSQNRIVVVSFYRWLICDSRLWRKSIFGKDKKQHSFTVILTRLTRNESFIGRGKELRREIMLLEKLLKICNFSGDMTFNLFLLNLLNSVKLAK